MFRLALVLALSASLVTAQDWPNWRGPNFDGSTTAKDLPTDFSPKKHVVWATPMPGPGASTPVIVGDRIFLSSVDTKRERLLAMCLDRKTGKVVWSKDADSGYGAEGGGSRVRGGRRSNYASPSAVTDGRTVVYFFGNGDLVAYDMAGKETWRRNIQKDYGNFAFQWTFSATPTFYDGRIYLPVLQRDEPVRRRRRGEPAPEEEAKPATPESFILALDPKNGKTLFKHVRPSPARKESLESYTTMIPRKGKGGREELVLVGGDVLTGHDPASGKELWRWGTWNEGHRQQWWRLVPTVTLAGDIGLVCAPKRAPVYAIKLGGDGDLGEKALLWKSDGRPNPVSSDVPSPAYHDGHFYVLSDVRFALSKVEAKTGKVVWTTELLNEHLWRASPTIADGKVFCINYNGLVAVVDAKDGKILAETPFGTEDDDQIRSTIVVAHGKIFIRTNDKLYCIGK